MKELILAYQGEMTLKGLNRGKFEARLAKIIRWRLEGLGRFKVSSSQSTVFIEPLEEDCDMEEAFRRVSRVFGIVKLSRAAVCDRDFATICQTAEAYLGETLRGIRTFKVEAKRADKKYPMTSPEICRELGAYLLSCHHHLRVNVHEPQLEVMVEIRDGSAYIHGPKVEAAGGLPVGTSGRALNLLSGGIDSPVAAWCMARRGLALHHIHFASPPYTSLRAKLKVRDLAREIVEYTGNCTLFVVP
ncbi:MAG: tRNA sulfurtransferase, partial [Gemmiger sp.]